MPVPRLKDIMQDFVILKQISMGEWADRWDALFVDISAPSPESAIDQAAKDEYKGGEGRYVAIPADLWVAQKVTVKKIAEVNMEREELI